MLKRISLCLMIILVLLLFAGCSLERKKQGVSQDLIPGWEKHLFEEENKNE